MLLLFVCLLLLARNPAAERPCLCSGIIQLTAVDSASVDSISSVCVFPQTHYCRLQHLCLPRRPALPRPRLPPAVRRPAPRRLVPRRRHQRQPAPARRRQLLPRPLQPRQSQQQRRRGLPRYAGALRDIAPPAAGGCRHSKLACLFATVIPLPIACPQHRRLLPAGSGALAPAPRFHCLQLSTAAPAAAAPAPGAGAGRVVRDIIGACSQAVAALKRRMIAK